MHFICSERYKIENTYLFVRRLIRQPCCDISLEREQISRKRTFRRFYLVKTHRGLEADVESAIGKHIIDVPLLKISRTIDIVSKNNNFYSFSRWLFD